jgi:peptidoglycan/xylan/chitin deacetylase (PgdA/CDA1 family)
MKNFIKLITVLSIICLALFVLYYFNYTPPILMYHAIDQTRIKTYAAVAPQTFARQMQSVKKWGFKVISLQEYCQLIADNKRPGLKTVIITFDDGYKDNLYAVEILKQMDFPATIFIIPSKLGYPGYLSREDIQQFLKTTKVTIGSHTLNHKYLPEITPEEIKEEISQSRKILQTIFNREINTLCYPTGGFNEETLQQAQNSGYLCACTTNRGFSQKIDRFSLRRVKISDHDQGLRLWLKLNGLATLFKKAKKPF